LNHEHGHERTVMSDLLGHLIEAGGHLGPATRYALWFALAAFSVASLLNAWRLFIGPGVEDRILALDTLYINSVALTVLFGILFDTKILFEAALLVAMFGFVGTVVLAKFLARGDIVE